MTSSIGFFIICVVPLITASGASSWDVNSIQNGPPLDEIDKEGNVSEDEKAAMEFLKVVSIEKEFYAGEMELATFNFETNITAENEQAMNDAKSAALADKRSYMDQARKYYENVGNYGNERLKRMLMLLVESDLLPKVPDEEQERVISKLESQMSQLVSTATVSYNGQALTVEPGLANVMASTFDYDILLDVWVQWRNATRGMRDDFTKVVEYYNKLAHDNDYADYGAFMRETEFEMPSSDVDALLEKVWKQVEPLYQQLHAYVRRRLIQRYRGRGIQEDGPIPAHLLGNMWAQEWNNLLPIMLPFPEAPIPEVTAEMKSQGYTPKKMFELADSFFVSLGMDPMTDIFWEKSVITKPPDRDMYCHGSAHDLHRKDDYRIKMCTEVNMHDLKTVHHEMGHIQYYMNYAHQPALFKSPAHRGFSEAVGDTIAMYVMTLEHFREIDLLPEVADMEEPEEQGDMNSLMRMALEKIPLLPFAYIVDKWSWGVYSGEVTEQEYNSKWWDYRFKYQGLEPPVERRDPDDFDPGAKYHVASFTPYIRYFVGHISQFQFLKALCDASGYMGPLHKCDIYQSEEAGNKLREMLSAGASKPWWEVMEKMTGSPEMDAGALLEYFQPLMDLLLEVNRDEYIGWR